MLMGPVGSFEPTGRVQPAIVSDHHRAPVRKRYRAPWLQSWRTELRERVLRERVLGLSAVWPSGSGRMASGIWPCGLWTLAAWRFLILHARLGVRGNQGRMVCNLPSPCPSTCHRCPDGALWWLASARTKRPTMGFSLIGALPAYEPRRQGGRECAVR